MGTLVAVEVRIYFLVYAICIHLRAGVTICQLFVMSGKSQLLQLYLTQSARTEAVSSSGLQYLQFYPQQRHNRYIYLTQTKLLTTVYPGGGGLSVMGV